MPQLPSFDNPKSYLKPETLNPKQLQSFDKGMPQPKNRQEEKKQKAEQLANLLRIQKELTSDYKVGLFLQCVCVGFCNVCVCVCVCVCARGVRTRARA